MFFFWKKSCEAPGGLKFHLLWIRYPSPQILRGSNFIFTLGHPFLVKTSKTSYFWHSHRVPLQRSPPSNGPPWKILHWVFCPNFFWGSIYMCRSQEKILAQKVNEKFFTVNPYLMGTGVRWTFRIFSFFYVWAFLGKKLWFKLFFQKKSFKFR